jgi:tryptophan synthase alpha chain
VVGFGIRTPEQAAEIAGFADGAVVGSAIVGRVVQATERGESREYLVKDVVEFCASLADSVHAVRRQSVVK